MKHFSWIIAGALLLMTAGCREESDFVLSYAFKDQMAFKQADSSFAGKFEVFWRGMNTNYALWDFEKANGLDWDQVYEEYYPRFAALDAVDTLVSDAQLRTLLDEVVAPLHDGHLAIQMHNHVSGNRVISSPGPLRILAERKDEYLTVASFPPSLQYYIDAGEVLEAKEASSSTFSSALRASMSNLTAGIVFLQEKPDRTPEEEELLALYHQVYDALFAVATKLASGDSKAAISDYNEIALHYAYLNIPGLETVDKVLNEYAISVKYALLKGNIAYLHFDSFKLSVYLNQLVIKEVFGTPSASTQAVIDEVAAVWRAWFNAIQVHHKAGDLGGVIIDVRSNGGGLMYDYRYVLGALLPSGGYYVTDARFKRGPGRYDYSPVLPQYLSTLDEEHVTVTEEPIVVLCNCASVSMAEQTSLSAKLLDNGKLIGTRTWGGLCALSPNETYSNDYAGHVGIMDETPVFCYIPRELVITKDGKVLEGQGVTPDIEIPLDLEAWKGGAGPDNQLDRALQYIRTGN